MISFLKLNFSQSTPKQCWCSTSPKIKWFMMLSQCTGTNNTDLLMPWFSSSQNRAALSIPTISNKLLLMIYHLRKKTVTGWNLDFQQSHITFQACVTVCSKFLTRDISKSAVFQELYFISYMNYTQWHIAQLNAPVLWFFLFSLVLVIQNFQESQKNPRYLLEVVFSLEGPLREMNHVNCSFFPTVPCVLSLEGYISK